MSSHLTRRLMRLELAQQTRHSPCIDAYTLRARIGERLRALRERLRCTHDLQTRDATPPFAVIPLHETSHEMVREILTAIRARAARSFQRRSTPR